MGTALLPEHRAESPSNPIDARMTRRTFLAGGAAAAASWFGWARLPLTPCCQCNIRDDPMAYRAARELVEALAKRRVSSRELVDSAIARIEALDSKINAVVVRDFERAPPLPPPTRRSLKASGGPCSASL